MLADPSKKPSSPPTAGDPGLRAESPTETRPGLGGPTPAAGSTAEDVLRELSGNPRGDDLARLVHTVVMAAADERRVRIEDGVTEIADRAQLRFEEAETRFGNVLAALQRGGYGPGEGLATRTLLGTLLARGVALSPPQGPEAEGAIVEALVWLAANTPVDALVSLDAALLGRADGLWAAVARLIRRADAGRAPQIGRAGAMVAAAALRDSTSETARTEANALAVEVRDPIVRALLRRGSPAADAAPATAAGELVPAPRGPLALAVLAIPLAVIHVARLLARLVLRYRSPAELRISARGVTIVSRTEMLGRMLGQRETHIPVEALLRATREVRFPRLAIYAGLFMLAVGSYIGVSLFVDGARAGSPELLGMGALVAALGIALDYVLENVLSGARGRCRVVIVPRKGRAVAVGGLDPALADAALRRLAP